MSVMAQSRAPSQASIRVKTLRASKIGGHAANFICAGCLLVAHVCAGCLLVAHDR
jgi:hypothetical protein